MFITIHATALPKLSLRFSTNVKVMQHEVDFMGEGGGGPVFEKSGT